MDKMYVKRYRAAFKQSVVFFQRWHSVRIVANWFGYCPPQYRPVGNQHRFLVVSGLQFAALGLLGEILVRTYYEAQGKPIYAIRRVIEREGEGQAHD